jgi:hypothetical protein
MDLSFKAAPSRSAKIMNDSIRKHAEPLEQVQGICFSLSTALAGHLSGKKPLSNKQLETIKNNLDEGKRLCKIRLRHHEDCNKKDIDVADEILLICSKGERDPSDLAFEKEAIKRVQEKRKAAAQAAKGDNSVSSEPKAKGKPSSWKNPPPLNPSPTFVPQHSAFNPSQQPPFPPYFGMSTCHGSSPQFPPSQPLPSPYPSYPGFNPFGSAAAGSGSSGSRGWKQNLQGLCRNCLEFGHQSADCPMAVSLATNAGKFSM